MKYALLAISMYELGGPQIDYHLLIISKHQVNHSY